MGLGPRSQPLSWKVSVQLGISCSSTTHTPAHTNTHTLSASSHSCYCLFLLGPAFDYLDAPILRVTGADVPMPYAKSLEALATPQPDNVVRTVLRMLNLE